MQPHGHFHPGNASLSIAAGGSFQSVSLCDRIPASDLLVLADVPEELQALPKSDRVLHLPLAEGQTLGTLTQRYGSPELRAIFDRRPGTILELGLGQVPPVGMLVADHVLQSEALGELQQTILDRLLELHQGRIRKVRLDVMSSLAGGTGSAIAPRLLEAFVDLFLRSTEAIVHARLFRIGSLSFTGLGQRVHPNAAAAIEEDRYWARGRPEHPRVVRSLSFFELPMVGGRKNLRDQDAAQFLQALLSRESQAILSRIAPNAALASPLGNVSLLRGGFWSALDARKVAASVAASYSEDLSQLLHCSAAPDAGNEIQASPRAIERPEVPSVAKLIALAQQSAPVLPAGFVPQCKEAEYHYRVDAIWVNTAIEPRSALHVVLRNRIDSLESGREKLSLLKAIRSGLRKRREELAHAMTEAGHRVVQAENELVTFLPSVFPRNWFRSLLSQAFLSPAQAFDKLADRITRLRERVNRLAELVSEKGAVDHATETIDRELRADQEHLFHCIGLLRNLAQVAPETELVRPEHPDRVLIDLLSQAREASTELPESSVRLLASCAAEVTIEGLAHIVGVESVRPWEIAEKLAQLRAVREGPGWGGSHSAPPGTDLLILPPLSAEDRDSIRSHLQVLAPSLRVTLADTSQGGANVLMLQVCTPRSPNDVMPPFYRNHLDTARSSPLEYFTRTNGTVSETSLEELS